MDLITIYQIDDRMKVGVQGEAGDQVSGFGKCKGKKGARRGNLEEGRASKICTH